MKVLARPPMQQLVPAGERHSGQSSPCTSPLLMPAFEMA
jgi:hypothetical protein